MPLPMTIPHGFFGVAGEDFGTNIPFALRLNSPDAPELSLTYTLNAPWTFSAWVKRANLGSILPLLGTGADKIYFGASNVLVAEGSTTTALWRDTTDSVHVHVSNNGLYVNGKFQIAVTTTNLTNQKLFDNFDGYAAEVHLQSGTQAVTEFGRYSTTDPKLWVNKTGPIGEHYLRFANSLNLGENSGTGGDWTATNITSDDQVTDTPTKNYAVLNSLYENRAGTLTQANLEVSGGSENQIGTIGAYTGAFTWQVTVGTTETQSHGVRSNTGTESLYTAAFTANDVIQFRLDVDAGTLERKLNTGAWTSVATGLTDTPYFPLVKGDCTLDFGQTGFTGTDAGSPYKLMNNRNTPKIETSVEEYVAVEYAQEGSIEANLDAVSSSWTKVRILKNRDVSETWAVQFDHSPSNEYTMSSVTVWQARRTLSGTNLWTGQDIRIGADYGTDADEVSHTSGVATTVTHNLNNIVQCIVLFNRANSSQVYVYHPAYTAGSLTRWTNVAAEAPNSHITNVTANSFDIGSTIPSGTYDYLVITSGPHVTISERTGNASTDGPISQTPTTPLMIWEDAYNDANSSTYFFDRERFPDNSANKRKIQTHLADPEGAQEELFDWLSNGFKQRNTGTTTNGSGVTIAQVIWHEKSPMTVPTGP